MPLSHFTPAVRDWFAVRLRGPDPVQAQAWPAIATGEHTLISAPTGSGKTLAAFLWGAGPAGARAAPDAHAPGLRLAAEGARLRHRPQPARAAARDRRGPHRRRPHRRHAADASARRCAAHPPDILITTPESLYLMLIQRRARDPHRRRGRDRRRDPRRRRDQARRAPRADARAPRRAAGRRREPQRIGLSATQNPLEEVGRFMVGPRRTCTIVDAGVRKPLDLQIHVPVESMVEPDQSPRPPDRTRSTRSMSGEATRRSIWPAIYPEILRARPRAPLDDRLRQRPPRRRAPRDPPQRARQRGPARGRRATRHRARAPRLARARGAARRRGDAEGRRAAVPRRDVVAGARHRHGRRRPRAAGRVAEVRRARPAAHRPRRPQRRRHLARAASSRSSAPTCSSARSSASSCATGEIEPTVVPRNALDVLAQQIVAIAAIGRDGAMPVSVDDLYALVTRTHSYAELSRALLENVLDMLDGRYPSQEFGELRARIVWDRVGGHDPRAQGRAPARRHERRHDPRPRPVLGHAARRPPRRRARRGDGLRGARRARRSCSARRRGGSRRSAATASSSRRRRARPGAVPFWRGDGVGPPEGARRGDRRVQPLGRRARTPRRSKPTTTSTRSPPEPARLPARAAGGDARRPVGPHDRRRALPRRDRRLAAVRPVALRRARARRLGPRAERGASARSTASSPTRSGPTTGSSSTSPTPTSRPAPSSCCSSPTRSRTPSCASSRRARCSARASARTPAARC